MIDKQVSYDHSLTENGHIQVRQITRLIEDGKEVSKTYHRHVVSPGDDYSCDDERTKKIAAAFHDEATIKAYKDKIAKQMELLSPGQ